MKRLSIGLAVSVALLTICGAAVPRSTAAMSSASTSLELEANLLTLEARDTTLVAVLEELGRLAGFRIVLVGDFDDSEPLNLTLSRVPVKRALQRLLGDTNNIIFHAEGGGEIVQVWLLGSATSLPQDSPVTADRGAESSDLPNDDAGRANSVLRLANQAAAAQADPQTIDQIQTTLSRIIAGDPDALVRARAALALGKLGTDVAVGALELATRDIDPSVRAQSINALGGIDSTRAINVLGAILSDTGRPVRSRVIAAQALWKQDLDLARGYLEMARTDANDQVRRSAAEPPPSLSGGTSRKQRGTAEFE